MDHLHNDHMKTAAPGIHGEKLEEPAHDPVVVKKKLSMIVAAVKSFGYVSKFYFQNIIS